MAEVGKGEIKLGSISNDSRDFTTKGLEFLSAASNETIGACLIGLAAVTYFVLGRIGLLLIGVFGGIILHATWEENNKGGANGELVEWRSRREVGLEVVRRVLDWQDRRQKTNVSEDDGDGNVDVILSAHKELDFTGFRPAVGVALTSLVDAIIKDYVKWWYRPILPSDKSFPFACRQTLTGFLLAVSSRLSRKRPADMFLDFLTNSTSIFIVFLSELSSALMAPGMADLSVPDAVHIYMEESPESNLVNVLNPDQQQRKFNAISEDILQSFLDSKTRNCEPVKVFLREILAGLVLESTLRGCSKSEWINGWIVYLLEEGEPEIMNAIDAGVGAATRKEPNSVAKSGVPENGGAVQSERSQATQGGAHGSPSHQMRVSNAEDAMEEALIEAKRLSEMIALEDAKKGYASEVSSGYHTQVSVTPTSSQGDLAATSFESSRAEVSNSITQQTASLSLQSSTTSTTSEKILASQPSALRTSAELSRPSGPARLTLHNTIVSIFDDVQPGEKAPLRSKPTIDYLLQIEPASSHHPGWMIARKYADFETLHEVLRRISVISGVTGFTQKHIAVPAWKNKTKSVLCVALEQYLRDALSHDRLAESEGMKRFLEKDQGLGTGPSGHNKGVLGFPTPAAFEAMGKGMLDVLASAPKGAADGGKAFLDGVSGVFSGPKNPPLPTRPSISSRSGSIGSFSRPADKSTPSTINPGLDSRESAQLPISATRPPLPQRPNGSPWDLNNVNETTNRPTDSALPESPLSCRPPARVDGISLSSNDPSTQPDLLLNLPPPPSEIPDDYNSLLDSLRPSISTNDTATYNSSISTAPSISTSPSRNETVSAQGAETAKSSPRQPKIKHNDTPLNAQETLVAVELFFATINELYTLSSAWTIRRTLLNAAKTFLLRPGNPSLEAIRVLLQDTVIEANTSDEGIAMHLRKLRENSLPTAEEVAAWPPPLTESEQEKLKVKARKLLVEKGMPQALTSFMGAAASGEALGRLFDCLQIEEVARGLMFALLLQGVRAITH